MAENFSERMMKREGGRNKKRVESERISVENYALKFIRVENPFITQFT